MGLLVVYDVPVSSKRSLLYYYLRRLVNDEKVVMYSRSAIMINSPEAMKKILNVLDKLGAKYHIFAADLITNLEI